MNTHYTTYSGKSIDFNNIKTSDFDIIDIANGLAKECRYNGQIDGFYSVAQHSVLACSRAFMDYKHPRFCLAVLLHDASEAYLKDIPAPVKAMLPDYIKLESVVMREIYKLYDIEGYLNHPDIKYYDDLVFGMEWAQFKEKSFTYFKAFDWKEAKDSFMVCFNQTLRAIARVDGSNVC